MILVANITKYGIKNIPYIIFPAFPLTEDAMPIKSITYIRVKRLGIGMYA